MFQIKRVCYDPPCRLGVFSDNVSVHDIYKFLRNVLFSCFSFFNIDFFRFKVLSHISIEKHYLGLEQLTPCFFGGLIVFFSAIRVHLNNRAQKIAIKPTTRNRSIKGLCKTFVTDK